MGRLEQGGFLFPDGTFTRFTGATSYPCSMDVPPQGQQPEGTIFVHTHPASRGESLDFCGGRPDRFYQNRPSDGVPAGDGLGGGGGDVESLFITGLDIGLIIDADGIIVFNRDYERIDNPDGAHFKGGDDGECGIER